MLLIERKTFWNCFSFGRASKKNVENQGNPTDENIFAQKCRGAV
jgi:hypothetical protein